MICVGVAQEQAKAWTAPKQVQGRHLHFAYRWQTVCVNHDSLHFVDRDWGPGFLKVCGYAPYPMKCCLNGHEWVKRQLTRRRVPFTPLDNGFQACARPAVLHTVCESLSAADVQAVFDRWVARLPLPVTGADRAAGVGHRLSLLQLEVSRTPVFARPLRGRECFEAVLRDQLDLGRPSRMQLLFDRKITRATPGRFRTRVITDGVVPSLHVEDTRCHITQSFQEGRALRTETPVNDPDDFGVQRGLSNVAYRRTLGQRITTWLLQAERVAHDCGLGEPRFAELVLPGRTVDGQPAPGLKFGQPRVMALLAACCLFGFTPAGITNRRLRPQVAQLLGTDAAYTPRQMGYDLRRLARKGLIQRMDGKLCYTLTPHGRRVVLILTTLYARVLRPGFQALDHRSASQAPPPLRTALAAVDVATDRLLQEARLVA